MAKKEKSKPLTPAVSFDASREEKKKALETSLKQITKDFGEGAVMKLGENTHMNVSAIHTGSLALDKALGIGGVPKGRIIEVFGPESSGKTTVALHVIAEAQKAGGFAAFIDAEHALDPVYAKALGVDTDELLISQPDCGEDALSICEVLVRSGAVDIVVIDSVAALVPRQEIEGDMGAATVGMQARLMSQAMRKLSGIVSKSQTVVIFINQIREKVGAMYGNPETTPGGRALKFYSSVRIDVRRTEQLKENKEVIGNHVRCKIVKNKVAPPFRTAEFDILYGKGISSANEVLDLAIQYEIIEKSGSWFSYNGERLGQGKENVAKVVHDDAEMFEEIKQLVREKLETVELPEAEDMDLEEDDEDSDDDFDIRTVNPEAGDDE